MSDWDRIIGRPWSWKSVRQARKFAQRMRDRGWGGNGFRAERDSLFFLLPDPDEILYVGADGRYVKAKRPKP